MIYFVFNVLLFGLFIVFYIFIKFLKFVISYWRGLGKRICMFLDDGLGGNFFKEFVIVDVKVVKEDFG